jgi:hypothetical protein
MGLLGKCMILDFGRQRMPVARPAKRPIATASRRPSKQREGKPLGLVLPPELVEEIDAIAATEKRSRVRMIEYILEDWLRSHRQGRAA